MTNYAVIINKKHSLFPQQSALLGGESHYMRIELPEKNASLAHVHELYRRVETMYKAGYTIVVVSPLSPLLALMARNHIEFKVMFNERRDEKIVTKPNGQEAMIQVAPSDGWTLF